MIDAAGENNLVRDGMDRVRDVAQFFRVSTSTVYGWMEKGILPFVKLGKSRRVPHRAVLELAARNLLPSPNPGEEGQVMSFGRK